MRLPKIIFAGNGSTLLFNSCNRTTTRTSDSYNRVRYHSNTSCGEYYVTQGLDRFRLSVANVGLDVDDILGLHFLPARHYSSSHLRLLCLLVSLNSELQQFVQAQDELGSIHDGTGGVHR